MQKPLGHGPVGDGGGVWSTSERRLVSEGTAGRLRHGKKESHHRGSVRPGHHRLALHHATVNVLTVAYQFDRVAAGRETQPEAGVMKLLVGNQPTGLSNNRDSVRRYAALRCLAEADRLDKAASRRRATAQLDVARDGCVTGRRIRHRNRPHRIRRKDQNHGPEQHGDASGSSYTSNR